VITLQHIATHCNALQHTATHCNALQHTATHCNTGPTLCGTTTCDPHPQDPHRLRIHNDPQTLPVYVPWQCRARSRCGTTTCGTTTSFRVPQHNDLRHNDVVAHVAQRSCATSGTTHTWHNEVVPQVARRCAVVPQVARRCATCGRCGTRHKWHNDEAHVAQRSCHKWHNDVAQLRCATQLPQVAQRRATSGTTTCATTSLCHKDDLRSSSALWQKSLCCGTRRCGTSRCDVAHVVDPQDPRCGS